MKNTITITVIDENTDASVSHALPAVWEICYNCDGNGTVDHPAFSNGISQEDFDEDPEFREDYFAGRYDVRCPHCKGSGKMLAVNEDALNENQRKVFAVWHSQMAEKARYEREDAAIRRAERGW